MKKRKWVYISGCLQVALTNLIEVFSQGWFVFAFLFLYLGDRTHNLVLIPQALQLLS